jgi:RHS repeat-associated protein
MNIKGLSANSTDTYKPNEYFYNGKMMQDEMGLNWLDYGARMYDPVLGRWHSVDLMAEKYPGFSPYAYTYNNPIIYIDPNGLEGWPVTRGWNRSDISGYSQYATAKIQEFKNSKVKDDCANFALRLIVGYASENGLPITLTNSKGTSFDAGSDKYTTPLQYLNDVRKEIQAKDLPLNTIDIPQNETQAGDMEIMHWEINEGVRKDMNHVAIFAKFNNKIPMNSTIVWGNMFSDGSGDLLNSQDYNWVRSSSYNDGTKNKFSIYSGNFNSRWKLLDPNYMRNNDPITKLQPKPIKEITIINE